ncbi:LOW QUALITY PROTEIN: olfactory receptor 1J4-like [Trichechus manatus latirostris]|uniref:Olfactory receptor n=1 Tax=Trichechus manatus latirostris TaxID=127582 RepID=A0A2Y9QTA1_TRIMA|nr:LOW QUALITY PROTEIN: olfactory receptor 1J4-like [Trichechus manatus latirostris]
MRELSIWSKGAVLRCLEKKVPELTKGCTAEWVQISAQLCVLSKSSMRPENQSSMSEFLLLGLPIRPEQQAVFFALFLGMYLATVLGNMLITLLIRLDSRLHTPMYFFLSHLSLSDISLSSVIVPKMLMNLKTHHQSIPYVECISQMYFSILFACVANLLLAVMTYDRYVAICHPLHYTTIMRGELCIFLVAGCWFFSCVHGLLHTLLVGQLSFCAETIIPHFSCDVVAVLKSSCSDTSLNELVIFTEGELFFIVPLSGILGSYIRMAVTILRVLSIKRLSKALSTCGSHLFVVSSYYGTLAGIYFFSLSGKSKDKDIIASVMYMVVTPMLNPFIYSLRNKDIKCAFDGFVRAKNFS